jgi:hypothetical protein
MTKDLGTKDSETEATKDSTIMTKGQGTKDSETDSTNDSTSSTKDLGTNGCVYLRQGRQLHDCTYQGLDHHDPGTKDASA